MLNAKDSVVHINEVHWHDSEIESVIEIPATDELIYNIQYPESWDQNIFVPKEVRFSGYRSHAVEEMPFEGNPTILAASIESESSGYIVIKFVAEELDLIINSLPFEAIWESFF